MTAGDWGDPAGDSFRKKQIRETRPAGAQIFVHVRLVSIVARLVEDLSHQGVEIPPIVTGYDPEGTEAQRLGLAIHLHIPVPPTDEIDDIVTRWGFEGFVIDSDVTPAVVELRFVGTPDIATHLNEQALAARLDRLEDPAVNPPIPGHLWPGYRDLLPGDTGADVRFLAAVLNVDTDTVDDRLIAAVKRFQQVRGAPRVDGRIDVHFWRRVLPDGRPHVSQGASGFIVRVLQAALQVYDGVQHAVTGVWGTYTTRDVAELQQEYGLRQGTFIRAPEWAVLLGPENPRILAARKRAAEYGITFAEEHEPLHRPDDMVQGPSPDPGDGGAPPAPSGDDQAPTLPTTPPAGSNASQRRTAAPKK